MRTTVAIEDALLAVAKRRATAQGLTLGQFLEQAIRHEIARDVSAPARPEVPVHHGQGGVRPGIDVTSSRSLVEALDEGMPIEKLR
jgi:hypothetical protein